MSDEPGDEELPPTAESGSVNVADPVAIKRKRRRRERDEGLRGEFWSGVFSTKIGRQEMWGILESGHAFAERFVTGPNGFPSPEATWKEAGEQSLAFRIYLSWLKLAPEGAALMLAENHPALAVIPKPNRG